MWKLEGVDVEGRMLNKCLGKLQEWSNSWYSACNFLQASNLNASLLIVLRFFFFIYYYCWKEEFMILISSQSCMANHALLSITRSIQVITKKESYL